MATNNKARLRRWQKRECGSKLAYTSRRQADNAAQRTTRDNGGWPFMAYACSWCGRLHVGHVGPNDEEFEVRAARSAVLALTGGNRTG